MNKNHEINLSKGSVLGQLIKFSLPLLISNIIQSLYNVADMIIVGQFCGTVSMSGVNIGGQVTFLITNLVIGLGAGATVLIGQYIGSGDKDKLEDTISTLFTALIVIAVIMTAFMLIFRGQILKVILTPAESYKEASNYLFITSLGTIFIFGYNIFSSVMRGMGDSRRPLYFIGIACGVNIILDLVFVGLFGMKASGAAIATILSQAISMILCILYFVKTDFVFKFNLKSFKIKKKALGLLLKIGGPMSVQNTVVSFSFLFMTAIVNTLGHIESAAVGAVGKINSFAILPAIAMSASISAICSHNIGAREYKRAVKTMVIGAIFSISITLFIFILVSIFPAQIISVFDNDPDLIISGKEYMKTFKFDYLFVPFIFSLNGLFIGSGHTTFSLINGMLSSILIRVPVAFIFGITLNFGLTGVGLAAPVASLISSVIGIVYFFMGRWKKSTIIK